VPLEDPCEEPINLPPLPRAAELALDYAHVGLSVSDHPIRLLRPRLPKHVRTSEALLKVPHGQRASVAGMVICRQRPMTASGVVFLTLEDETGFSNIILYARIFFEEQRYVATTSHLIIAQGKVERDGDVVYLIPERLESLSLQEGLPGMSRDFH
jgi:error-prone DNA polymerase